MKTALTFAFVLIVAGLSFAAKPISTSKPTLYIAPDEGFQTALTAAIEKKQVPVSLFAEETGAQYRLETTPLKVKTQTTGSKVARCLFADCIGIQDSSTVSVQLVDLTTKQIVWAYSVHKQWGGSRNDQSMAEAIAKHLKQFLEKHPLQVALGQASLTGS
jgi:hypothetical protein